MDMRNGVLCKMDIRNKVLCKMGTQLSKKTNYIFLNITRFQKEGLNTKMGMDPCVSADKSIESVGFPRCGLRQGSGIKAKHQELAKNFFFSFSTKHC